MKHFDEAIKDGFNHVTDITDLKTLKKFRDDGIEVDSEGYWSFAFGDKKEYELCFEPFREEGKYLIALYKNRVLLTEKIFMKKC